MKGRKRILQVAIAFLLLNSGSGLAEDMPVEQTGVMHALHPSGSLRGGYWSSSMNLDGRSGLAGAALWLKAEPQLGDNVSAAIEGWARSEDAFYGGGRHGLVRESYLSASMGDADFRIGKQIIIWGKADRFNPTDNLAPRDYTLLVPEDDDQRFGRNSVKATYNFQGISATAIWQPGFNPNVLPLPHMPGMNFSEPIPQASQRAFRLEQSGKAIDWSISYFHGTDLNPDISIGSIAASGMTLRLDHHRVRVFGADAATVIGRYGFRAEAAYTTTEDAGGRDPFIKNPFFYLVAGGDRAFLENLNVNMQFYFRQVASYSDPRVITNPIQRTVAKQSAIAGNQLERIQHGMIFRIGNKWMNETLEGKIAGIYSFTSRDFAFRPKLVYALDDRWKGTIGASIFRGGSDTYYGQLRDNSIAFFEIKYGF